MSRQIFPQDIIQLIDQGDPNARLPERLGYRHGETLAWLLAGTPQGLVRLKDANYRLARAISKEVLNDIIISGPNKGQSVALRLSSSVIGREILTLNGSRLALEISEDALNYICKGGSFIGCSVALYLAGNSSSYSFWKLNDFQLVRLLSKDTFDEIIPNGRFKGESLALLLAFNASDSSIWECNDFQLTRMLSEKTFNHAVMKGRFQGDSVARCLMSRATGLGILKLDDFRLARMISSDMLSDIISKGIFSGLSFAQSLAITDTGRDILALNDYRLARMISENDLNKIIPRSFSYYSRQCGHFEDESVALNLASCVVGRDILKSDGFRLARLISKPTLNYKTPAGRYKGQSVALSLAGSTSGRDILKSDGFRLARIISKPSLNDISSAGRYKGESIALCLASCTVGCDILNSHKFRLAKDISKQTLNYVAAEGRLKGWSVVQLLARTDVGRKILTKKRNRSQLTRMISVDTLIRMSESFAEMIRDLGESRVLQLIHSEVVSLSLTSPKALVLLRAIDRQLPAMLTTELLTKVINSSADKVKQWGLCFLIKKAVVSLEKRLYFSNIDELKESLCTQCELLNTKKQDLSDSMMKFALICIDKDKVDFRAIICHRLSCCIKQIDSSALKKKNRSLNLFYLHFSRLLYSRKSLSYQMIYRLCHSFIIALQANPLNSPTTALMILYSAHELARELTLRLRVMQRSAIREDDASTTLSLAIAEYVGVESCTRYSGESYALNLVIPKLIEERRSAGLVPGAQMTADRAQQTATASCPSASASASASSDLGGERSPKRQKCSAVSDRGSLIFANHKRDDESGEKECEDTSNEAESREMAKLNEICMDLGL